MKRTTKTVYADDQNRELLSIKNNKVTIERAYADWNAEELDELASACSAAAEELRSLSEVTT